jgi:predicted membrane protein
MEEKTDFRLSPQLVLGILVVILGVVFTLGNLDLIDSHLVLQYWPVAFIFLGGYILVTARELTGRFTGVLVLVIGFLLLSRSLGYIYFRVWDFWPLVIVILGLNMVLQALQGKVRPDDSEKTISGIAILGGFKRSCTSSDFRGGELTAFMGGGELDLRQASIDSGRAILTLYAFMGGFKLFIPTDWTVTCKALPLLGGVDDKTLSQRSNSEKNLIIQGYVVLGGIEIHN